MEKYQMNMKKTLATIASALMLVPAFAQDPQGSIVYSLPSTTLNFDVEAVQENFYAGPYAKYAFKYLGIEVGEQDRCSCHITKVTLTPYIEADQKQRYVIDAAGAASSGLLKLSAQGLIAFSNGNLGESGVWRFPSGSRADFPDKGISSNLQAEETTLYRNNKDGNNYSKVGVQQNMIVEKSPEKRAAETAELIFELRKKRVQIVTGDTDATYSGEAMGAAIEEISRLEREYMSLFIGYSEFKDIRMRFELVPEKGLESQKYVAFRVSDQNGLVAADDLAGTPALLELIPEEICEVPAAGKPAKGPFIHYRIPAICKVKLYKGTEVLLQSRVPVYQLGTESTFPVKTK